MSGLQIEAPRTAERLSGAKIMSRPLRLVTPSLTRLQRSSPVRLRPRAAAKPAGPRPTQPRATPCRQRAEQAYEQQNRAAIYSPLPRPYSPIPANYTPSQTERGLSDLFANDRMVSDCVRNTGTGTERAPPSPSSSQ